MTPNLLGVVLCGGESRRMGRDKGLLETDGVPWAIRMGEKLDPWRIPVVWSINAKQRTAYGAILPPERLIEDALGLPGPLDGLFSIHARYPGQDLLLLACDMQDLDEATIGRLIGIYRSRHQEANAPSFYVYRDNGFLQPFCGIYTAAGLAPIHRMARTGVLSDFSLQSLLKSGGSMQLPVADPGAFRNYNTV